MDDLIQRLRKMAQCIYIAVEQTVADDVSDGLTKAAARIERLTIDSQHLLDIIDAQGREWTPSAKRESNDDANSRDERDQVFGDAVVRLRAAVKGAAQ